MNPLLLLGLSTLIPAAHDATFDERTGRYEISDPTTGWTLAGRVEAPVRNVRRARGRGFREISFEWEESGPVRGTIRVDDAQPVFRFRLEYLGTAREKAIAFPRFTSLPERTYRFSYQDKAFAPYTFDLAQTSTPWLLFDADRRALIFSPASQFMVAKMVGDGRSLMAASLDHRLRKIPRGLKQESVLVFSPGIGEAWDRWGETMRRLYRRPMTRADSDPVLRSIGNWSIKEYGSVLRDPRPRRRTAIPPFAYTQLDDWWYPKLSDDLSGEVKPWGRVPNRADFAWERKGGILQFRAAPDLSPDGLAGFARRLGQPLMVSGRWIGRHSPLRDRYRISGVAPIDPNYWTDTADYLATSGVTGFEQDWLEAIFRHSPEMAAKVGIADAFTDGMAHAMRTRGITMQYGMATPRFYLQGLKYPNLTAIRAGRGPSALRAWAPILFGGHFSGSLGIYPWSDEGAKWVMGETILAVLSMGPVGVRDSDGFSWTGDLGPAIRWDGVVVRPDRTLVPTDGTYLNEAEKNDLPFEATTWTDHSGLRTHYFFAFPRNETNQTYRLRLADHGITQRTYLYDLGTTEGRFVEPTEACEFRIGSNGFVYQMAVPVSRAGIALIGDRRLIVPTGKQRIALMEDRPEGLRVRVLFGKGERKLPLSGFALGPAKVHPHRGAASFLGWKPVPGHFSLVVAPDKTGTAEFTIDGRR